MPDAKSVLTAAYDDVRGHLDRVESGDEEPSSLELNDAIGALNQMSAQALYPAVEEHVDGGEALAEKASTEMADLVAEQYGDLSNAKAGSKELDTAVGKLRKGLDARERKDLKAIEQLAEAGEDLDRLGKQMS